MRNIRIGHLARLFGRDTSTIRRWEREGRIPPARRDPFSGQRCWNREEVIELQQRLGFRDAEAEGWQAGDEDE